MGTLEGMGEGDVVVGRQENPCIKSSGRMRGGEYLSERWKRERMRESVLRLSWDNMPFWFTAKCKSNPNISLVSSWGWWGPWRPLDAHQASVKGLRPVRQKTAAPFMSSHAPTVNTRPVDFQLTTLATWVSGFATYRTDMKTLLDYAKQQMLGDTFVDVPQPWDIKSLHTAGALEWLSVSIWLSRLPIN